jgi:hypothetical protein
MFAVDPSSVAAAGAATGVVFFLLFFVLVSAWGAASIEVRARGTMMTSILSPEVSAIWDAVNSETRWAGEAAAMVEGWWPYLRR